jgi:hypothetical protein
LIIHLWGVSNKNSTDRLLYFYFVHFVLIMYNETQDIVAITNMRLRITVAPLVAQEFPTMRPYFFS